MDANLNASHKKSLRALCKSTTGCVASLGKEDIELRLRSISPERIQTGVTFHVR
jgi:hypothetical protein